MSRPRTPTHSQIKEQALREAARTSVPSTADVCVIGAGASGLVAAIVAAESGRSALCLESSPEAGRSILATGNGRCNFCNADLGPEHYNHPEFVRQVMGDRPLDEVLDLFAASGLAWTVEDGRYYPRSLVAASVRNVLLCRARAAGVTLACARPARQVRPHGHGLLVSFDQTFAGGDRHCLCARSVIVASGGGAVEALSSLGLACVPTSPVLCALSCRTDLVDLSRLDGRRARCVATLLRDGAVVTREPGEVLFRSYGLSGIVILDLSRHALPHDVVSLDLAPDLGEEALVSAASRVPDASHALDGLLDPVVASALMDATESDGQSPDRHVRRAAHLAKDLSLSVEGLADTDRAQVTRGGLSLDGFSPRTLECTSVEGLFACGEALDVDACCGGYNLAWAWTSGMVAGRGAATRGGDKL